MPAYVIFGDAVLRELARVRPTSIEKLTNIRGIGDRKREEFGQLFLDSIDQYCEENPLDRNQTANSSPTTMTKPRVNAAPNAATVQASQLFRDGCSVEEVASKMGRAESTVNKYLSDYIQAEKITDPSQWVSTEESEAIRAALMAAEDERLRPVFEALGEEVSYEKIRIVASCMKNEMADDSDD